MNNDNHTQEERRQLDALVAAAMASQPGGTARKAAKDKPAASPAPDAGTEPGRQPDAAPSQPSLADFIRVQATESDSRPTAALSLHTIIGGDILNTTTVRKQIWLFLLITVFIIVYISNRYRCQQDLIRISQLNNELNDAKYRALSSTSMLTEKCRESRVLEMLKAGKDSTLHMATQPPYIITIPENYEQQ